MKEVILNSFSVVNTFRTDCYGKGKLAEDDFVLFFYSRDRNKGKTLFDVRKVPYYQKTDIDFVIDNEGGKELPSVETVFSNKKRYIKVEVKYNTPALRTGKIAFEIVSHGKKGWGEISKCDFIYMVFGREIKKNNFTIDKRCLIKFDEWRSFIKDKDSPKEQYRNIEENIVNVMSYIRDLEGKKILTFV